MNLTANTILITGGASGIGFALAQQLSNRGNNVIICGRSEAALLKAQAEVPALITRVCDIADTTSRLSIVSWLDTAYPELNIVINNAGVQFRRDLKDCGSLENLEQEVAINFTAPVRLIGELLPQLKRQSQAMIINVSSALAFAPRAGVPVYCATKAAMHSYTLSLRHQLKAIGIRVVEMAPPIVDTGLGGENRIANSSVQTMMTSEDFAAEALAQLESDQDEVLVGLAAGARKMGEALFGRINGA